MSNVWHWPPNGLSESLEFATDIRKSRTAESRYSYKDATQRLNVSHILDANIGESLVEKIRENPLSVWLVPEWPVASFSITTPIEIGNTSAAVPDSVVYTPGQSVIVGSFERTYEILVVDTVGSGVVNFTTAVTIDHLASDQAPAFIAPANQSILPSGIAFSSRFPVLDIQAEFLNLQPIDIANDPYIQLDGLPVVTNGRVAFQALSGNVQQAAQLVESGFGAYSLLATEDYVRRYGTVSIFDETYDERLETRRFLHFLRGQDGEFWLPTDQRDLILNGSVGSSALTADIQPIASDAAMVGRGVLFDAGTSLIPRLITSATTQSATSQLIQFSALGSSIDAGSVVTMLHKMRLDDDKMNIGYQFTGAGLKASFTVPSVEVP